ncbi:hypothetical protein V6N11_081130 [Hibiscus sabdariffa]|uniref:Uncharacterized protein n=1 Tax=Hibiscus sabdariffa TaxID=183260 RepID=A0ABR2QIY9_9ROSI
MGVRRYGCWMKVESEAVWVGSVMAVGSESWMGNSSGVWLKARERFRGGGWLKVGVGGRFGSGWFGGDRCGGSRGGEEDRK